MSTAVRSVRLLLYLEQSYLSGIAKRKPAFRELEPVLRHAVRRGAVQVPESGAIGSSPRHDGDAFMADLIHRARLDLWYPCESSRAAAGT